MQTREAGEARSEHKHKGRRSRRRRHRHRLAEAEGLYVWLKGISIVIFGKEYTKATAGLQREGLGRDRLHIPRRGSEKIFAASRAPSL